MSSSSQSTGPGAAKNGPESHSDVPAAKLLLKCRRQNEFTSFILWKKFVLAKNYIEMNFRS